MSNTERNPDEWICSRQATDSPSATDSRSNNGLRSGSVAHTADIAVLEPREVPLGGPRAMEVRRTLPQRARSLISGWCLVDLYGPQNVLENPGMKVPRHPHTGLATCSWLFSGAVDHVDSAGNRVEITPGDVALMNAGSGITHSEFSTDTTETLHGVQLWYAFPDAARFTEPSLHVHRAETATGSGWEATVLLGDLLGVRSPAHTYLELSAAEIRLDAGTTLRIPVPEHHEHGLLMVSGTASLGGVVLEPDHLAVQEAGSDEVIIEAGDEPALVMLLGGEPLGEQIIMWWNFVGRSHDEIVKYRAQYQAEMGFDDDGAPTITESTRRFGHFPPGEPDPLPAPALPNTRMKPRG